MFTHITVSRSPLCAVSNLTGDTSSRASPDARHTPQKSSPCLGLVPYPLELCHARHDTPGQTWHRGVSRNCAPLAPRDVERHMEENGPWQYKLSQLYDAPEVTEALEAIA